jgi:hypothetical protein
MVTRRSVATWAMEILSAANFDWRWLVTGCLKWWSKKSPAVPGFFV